jgi:hypothetical protein
VRETYVIIDFSQTVRLYGSLKWSDYTVLSNGPTIRFSQTVRLYGSLKWSDDTVLSNGPTIWFSQTVRLYGSLKRSDYTVLSNGPIIRFSQTVRLYGSVSNIQYPISHPIPDIPPISRQRGFTRFGTNLKLPYTQQYITANHTVYYRGAFDPTSKCPVVNCIE